MSSEIAARKPSPIVVAIAAWLVPGLGFWLLGQRSRGVAIFISIIALFILGVLIGGIRVVDPPGYGQYGYKVQLVQRVHHPSNRIEPVPVRVDPTSPAQEENPVGPGTNEQTDHLIGWALTQQFLSEIGNKPWFVGQILCGPVSVAMSSISLHAAHPELDSEGRPIKDPQTKEIQERVPASHSRSWEIGTLYTAVAGMLNLLAIIDSTYRASATEDE